MLFDQGTFLLPYECRDAETYYLVTRRSEINQPHTIASSVCMGFELSNSGVKDIFPPDLSIEISEDDFYRALIVYVLEFSVEAFLTTSYFPSVGV